MSSDIVIDEGNTDLTTDQPLNASEALAAVERIEVERAAAKRALIPDVHLPIFPADGTTAVHDKTGRVLVTITPADTAAIEKWQAEDERTEAEHKKYWNAALEKARSACGSAVLLKDLREHDRLDELAEWLMIFGDTEGLKLFREAVLTSGTLDGCQSPETIIFDVWNEHHVTPGDWRGLIWHVRELERVAGGDPPKPGASTNPSTPGDLTLVQASDVKLKKYDWLWNGYLVRGKFHVVAGAPSGGKTTLMLKLCAIVSSGGTWPDGTQAKVGKVLIWSGEDDINDTLVPRLKAMGANLSNVYFVESVVDAISGTRRSFDPATDLAALHRAVQRIGDLALILVDPVVSFVGGDSHKNSEVRRGLQPLVDIAQECGAALVGISHFSKGTAGRDPVERVTGSLAFGAAARVVFAVAKRVDEESREIERIFVRAKSNIGPSDGGFKFAIDQVHLPPPDDMEASVVTWGESLEGTARDLLKEAEGAGESSKSEDAAEMIQETIRIKGGEVSANDLRAALKSAGIGRDSGYRAINALLEQHRIARVKYSENGPWTYLFQRRGGVADVSAFDPAASDSAGNGDLVGGAA